MSEPSDSRNRIFSAALAAVLATAILTAGGVFGTGESFASEGLRALDLVLTKEGEQRYRLTLKTTGPLTSASCQIREDGGAPLLVLELPLVASGGLKPLYEFPGTPLGAARAIPTPGGKGIGLRLEIPLAASATLRGWESTPEGIGIYLVGTSDGEKGNGEDPYQIGIGDSLELAVFGHDDLHQILEVLADGTIVPPLVGVLPVAGKSVTQVRATLQAKMKDFLVDPQVTLEIKDYKSQPVNVVGEVKNPGKFFLRGPTTLVDIIAQAGWMDQTAGSDILITRHEGVAGSGGTVRQILVKKDDLLGGDQKFNPQVRGGDTVTIGPKQYFYIRGEVTNPGQYPLENRPTLLKAMSIAGGLNPYAKRRAIELLRTVKGVQTKKIIDLKAIEDRKIEDLPLLPDDVVIVPRRMF